VIEVGDGALGVTLVVACIVWLPAPQVIEKLLIPVAVSINRHEFFFMTG
jgi:hypothetical protein